MLLRVFRPLRKKKKTLNIIDGRRKCWAYLRLFFFLRPHCRLKKRRSASIISSRIVFFPRQVWLMLLINTTLELVRGQFSSAFKYKIQCLVDIESSLRMHYIVVNLIHVVILYIDIFLILVHGVGYIAFPSYRNFIRAIWPYIQLPSNALEDKHFYVFLLFVKEIALTSIYVLFAFLYKWFGLTNNNSPITSLNFSRWIIEGSCATYLFLGLFWVFYMESSDLIFGEYQVLYLFAITLKVPVYIFMRCAESRPDFFLNRLESDLLISFCEPDSGRKLFFKLLQYIK